MIEITYYHWIWYLIGFIFCPQLTFMIWLNIYFRNVLPQELIIVGWIITILSLLNEEK